MWKANSIQRLSPREIISLGFLLASLAASPFLLTPFNELTTLQIGMMVVLVTLFGLPHGALDAELARKMNLISTTNATLVFFTVYLLLAVLGIGLWLIFPVVGLSIFLLISAYHFADDWSGLLPRSLCLVIGSIIICMPAVEHGQMVWEIFQWLLVSEDQATTIVGVLKAIGIAGSILLVVGLLIHRHTPALLLLEIFLLWTMAILLSPLLFFTLYFCFLHSMRHLTDCAQKLAYSPRKCYLKSLPILALTLVIALTSYFFFNSGTVDQDLLRWVFIGLFALTIPHVFLITVWYRSSLYRQMGNLR